jgi:hypothetical protein
MAVKALFRPSKALRTLRFFPTAIFDSLSSKLTKPKRRRLTTLKSGKPPFDWLGQKLA